MHYVIEIFSLCLQRIMNYLLSLHPIISDVYLTCIIKPKKYIQHMKRKDYERPTMMVVQLQHVGMLMASDPTGSLPGSQTAETDDWD